MKFIWTYAATLAVATVATSAYSAVLIDGVTPYTQNFDSMGAATNNSSTAITLPAEWAASVTGGSFNTDGSAGALTPTNSSKLLNLGSSGNGERALGIGFRGVGSYTGRIGVAITNNASAAFESLSVSFTGEQWRTGGNRNFNPDMVDPATLQFEYSTNATSLTDGTWVAVTALDFSSLVNQTADASLNGNLAANREAVSHTFALSLVPGATVWIRWTSQTNQVTGVHDSSAAYTAATNQAHFIGIDDLSLTATLVPEPASLVLASLGGLLMLPRRRRA